MLAAILHIMGLDDASGSWYLLWSGFFADISILAAPVILFFRHVCHERGCFRIGKHRLDGTPYTLCRKHHPET
jgi:hypothetical protein